MKFFWWYVIGFISVLFISSYVVSIRDEGFAVDGTENESNNVSARTQYTDHSFVEYHDSEETLRKSSGHQLKGMQMIDENGVPVIMDFEPTQVFPVYYTPGSYLYGASAFVPTYEESVKLSNIKSLLKKDIDPVQFSFSVDTYTPPEKFNHLTPVPNDLTEIVKEDIPSNRIVPTGYFILPRSKSDTKYQMGMIPEGFYIYDDKYMAQVPPGFLASVDKTYIIRKSDATQSNRYIATTY
jgi:hypothetical protein